MSQPGDDTHLPLIVGIGGTTRPNSSTEQSLDAALASAQQLGARTRKFGCEFMCALPHYFSGGAVADSAEVRSFIAAIREAKGLIIASPGYHGSVSGLVKNALDYIEETAQDDRVYLDGVAVGLICTAHGWQATGSTLIALRSIVHSLRGWPTPLGVAIKAFDGMFNNGVCEDQAVAQQLSILGRHVVEFAQQR